jgi:hypothetical protein
MQNWLQVGWGWNGEPASLIFFNFVLPNHNL